MALQVRSLLSLGLAAAMDEAERALENLEAVQGRSAQALYVVIYFVHPRAIDSSTIILVFITPEFALLSFR